ncbi:hypothetical protein CMV_010277 [Castanea mollissima]|uniref:Uncharacterized protein n=1 Tax=Castanea mollissima TaxID=60419 RepID=A0A8J4W0V3_9ROSI|nr:hypothetical protein CMV_010277 [Castanea mollissima]
MLMSLTNSCPNSSTPLTSNFRDLHIHHAPTYTHTYHSTATSLHILCFNCLKPDSQWVHVLPQLAWC